MLFRSGSIVDNLVDSHVSPSLLDDIVDGPHVVFTPEEEPSSVADSFVDNHTPSPSYPGYRVSDRFTDLVDDVAKDDVILVPTRTGEEWFVSVAGEPTVSHTSPPPDGGVTAKSPDLDDVVMAADLIFTPARVDDGEGEYASSVVDSFVDSNTPSLPPPSGAPVKFVDFDNLRAIFAPEEESGSVADSFIDKNTPSTFPPSYRAPDNFMYLDEDVVEDEVIPVPTRASEEWLTPMADDPVNCHIPLPPVNEIFDISIDLDDGVERANAASRLFVQELQSVVGVGPVRIFDHCTRFPPLTCAKQTSHITTGIGMSLAEEGSPTSLNGGSRTWGYHAFNSSKHTLPQNGPDTNSTSEPLQPAELITTTTYRTFDKNVRKK